MFRILEPSANPTGVMYTVLYYVRSTSVSRSGKEPPASLTFGNEKRAEWKTTRHDARSHDGYYCPSKPLQPSKEAEALIRSSLRRPTLTTGRERDQYYLNGAHLGDPLRYHAAKS